METHKLVKLGPVCKLMQTKLKSIVLGGSPCLVVMGDDSCLKGRGFESWSYILNGDLDIFSD